MVNFGSPYNAFEREIIFCIWFGKKIMPVNKAAALLSILNNVNVPVQLLHDDNFRNWEIPEHSFHPAFEFLTDTHKSDYLRAYLMYHYGGGYTDIKFTFSDWSGCFHTLGESNKHFLGYRETAPNGVCLNLVEKLNPSIVEQLRSIYQVFPGTSAFIFKQGTPFARDLLEAMHSILDAKFDDLRCHPGRFPQEFKGSLLEDKTISRYPLDWVELLGDNFHALAFFSHLDNILYGEIKPSVKFYRSYP